MANLTDPLLRATLGSDPQNLMEYITRQKIYDSRFWKEECFGLTTADVLEKAATLKNLGGTFGANHQPTKFLCLALKLLQLQPDLDLVETFLCQPHFKYATALGAFYLRLTGRPAEIYQLLEPLYMDFRKLRYRDVSQWKLVHMDEWIHQLLTTPFGVGVALPRLPARETLQQEGFLEEGPRKTALQNQLEEYQSLEALLKFKAEHSTAAEMLERRRKDAYTAAADRKAHNRKEAQVSNRTIASSSFPSKKSGLSPQKQKNDQTNEVEPPNYQKRTADGESDPKHRHKKRKKAKRSKYGSLFKKEHGDYDAIQSLDQDKTLPAFAQEGSEDYWNVQRANLGLAPLRKSK